MRPKALMGVVDEPERIAEGPGQALHESLIEHVLCAHALPDLIKHAIESPQQLHLRLKVHVQSKHCLIRITQ